MVYKTTFNLNEAHEYFSVEYFNQTREFIEMAVERSVEENMAMLHTAFGGQQRPAGTTHARIIAGWAGAAQPYPISARPGALA